MMRPNIVFVLTDDQGYGDLGCTGNPIVQTPNIDGFYKESVRLTDYHVGPTCAPTRAGLMTGHYANSTGVWHTVGGRSLLRKDEVTLASALKDAGYRTGIFGKWHLGDAYPYRPMDRGFEETVVHGGGGISQTPDWWGNDYFDDTYFANGIPQKYDGYCTDVFFEEAMDFIDRHQKASFFCCITTNAPHGPFNVEDTYSKPYMDKTNSARARFYGMITNIDDNFGRLEKKLEDLGIADKTILVFMTDNGTSCGISCDKAGYVTDGYNNGLRGGKNSEYDGGHRVPYFIRWADGGVIGGRDMDELTANVDFMPTMLDLCGVTDHQLSFHGESIASQLRGDSGNKDRIIVTDSQRLAYPMKWRKSAVMTSKWRLINGRELYDIQGDREQRKDISHSHPEVVERLRKAYEDWWDLVSTQYDACIPYPIGSEPMEITCHDIRNEECVTAWNQKQVRAGVTFDGYYEVEVEEAGLYSFTLRRWPAMADSPISQGIRGKDVDFAKEFIEEEDWKYYSGSTPLAIHYAQVEIQGQSRKVAIDEGDTEAVIELSLEPGETKLYCRFLSKEGAIVTSAYFIEVKKQ